MIKAGYTLYAAKANGGYFRKQAKSPEQFVRLCIAEEKAKHGFIVTRAGRWRYEPDFYWSDADKRWHNRDGSVYGEKLPPGF